MVLTTQRNLIIGIALATLAMFAIVIADLASGGRADPPALRAAATLLDGQWRFRTGDDPRWAQANIDDSSWETVDLTATPGSHDGDVGLPDYVGGWMARGHADYHGYAWYRRVVTVPPGSASWDILGPTLVEDGYEIYWNGERLGGSGTLGAHPRLVGTRPMRFALPAGAAGTRGGLAVRAYMSPESGGGADSGGMHTPPILAPRPISDALHRAQWDRTIAGYIADLVEPIAMFALIALALVYRSRSNHRGFLVFASVALAFTALRRLGNAIVSWTDLEALSTYAWLASWMWAATLGAWVLAWNRWPQKPWRSIDVLGVALGAAGIISGMMHAESAASAVRFASIAVLAVIAIRVARSGRMPILALVTLLSIMLALLGGELLDPIGVPGIWFPFGIGVSRTQFIYAIVIPLLGFLIARTVNSEDRADSTKP